MDNAAKEPRATAVSHEELQESIRRRAEDIYVRSGRIPGRDVENWVQAEREIRAELATGYDRRTAVAIRIEGVEYLGEYNAAAASGYLPGEFTVGAPVGVRFEGDRMFVLRHNGSELETAIVRRTKESKDK